MMNDALALLAISQLVCIGGLAYLYMQLQAVQRRLPRQRTEPGRVPAMAPARVRAARDAYAPRPAGNLPDAASLATRAAAGAVDVPSLARRLGKSEEEVRLLLRRRGIAS